MISRNFYLLLSKLKHILLAKTNMEGRLLKTEPRFNVELNEEQKEVVRQIYDKDVTFIHGDFGSGKSLTAVYTALKMFRQKKFNKIWITRPITKNKIGALPGSIAEKLDPYVFPIIQNLQVCQGKQLTDKMIAEGLIEIMPIDVAKGVTFMDSVVIVDEYEDMDYGDFRTILTRLGNTSKMIFCGSIEQIDKSVGLNSCIYSTMKLKKTEIVGYATLTSNHRNPILTDIINYLEKDK